MFPYYIVRFKQYCPPNGKKYQTRFHTTQYDLNFFFCFLNFSDIRSFHTTQYDLNRFLTPKTRITLKFPYYIVRFKPQKHFPLIYLFLCFHTTQYDLNSILLFLLHPRRTGFHTTQYDLNSDYEFWHFILLLVSILHSTI